MSEAQTKSTKSRLGRPKVYAPGEEPVIVPTRIPTDFHSALKYLAVVPNEQGISYGSEIKMYDALLTRFLEERPFERAFTWRTCGSIMRYENGQKDRTSWKQLNVQMKQAMKHEVEMVAAQQNQSVAAFLYSALFWWVYTVKRLPMPSQPD